MTKTRLDSPAERKPPFLFYSLKIKVYKLYSFSRKKKNVQNDDKCTEELGVTHTRTHTDGDSHSWVCVSVSVIHHPNKSALGENKDTHTRMNLN